MGQMHNDNLMCCQSPVICSPGTSWVRAGVLNSLGCVIFLVLFCILIWQRILQLRYSCEELLPSCFPSFSLFPCRLHLLPPSSWTAKQFSLFSNTSSPCHLPWSPDVSFLIWRGLVHLALPPVAVSQYYWSFLPFIKPLPVLLCPFWDRG